MVTAFMMLTIWYQMLLSVGLIAQFLVSIPPKSLSVTLTKAWLSIHLDKELPPSPTPNQAQLKSCFPRQVWKEVSSKWWRMERTKTKSQSGQSWPTFPLTPCPRAAVKSITYQSLLQRSYLRIKLLHLKFFYIACTYPAPPKFTVYFMKQRATVI